MFEALSADKVLHFIEFLKSYGYETGADVPGNLVARHKDIV